MTFEQEGIDVNVSHSLGGPSLLLVSVCEAMLAFPDIQSKSNEDLPTQSLSGVHAPGQRDTCIGSFTDGVIGTENERARTLRTTFRCCAEFG